MTFYVQYTPVHPEGYPGHSRSKGLHSITKPFLARNLSGGPIAKYQTRELAQAWVEGYHELASGPHGTVGTKYELKAEVIEKEV